MVKTTKGDGCGDVGEIRGSGLAILSVYFFGKLSDLVFPTPVFQVYSSAIIAEDEGVHKSVSVFKSYAMKCLRGRL